MPAQPAAAHPRSHPSAMVVMPASRLLMYREAHSEQVYATTQVGDRMLGLSAYGRLHAWRVTAKTDHALYGVRERMAGEPDEPIKAIISDEN